MHTTPAHELRGDRPAFDLKCSSGRGPVACRVPMEGSCPEGCCPLVGELFEVPSDLSCRRTVSSGSLGCFEVDFAGCGGGFSTICHITRATDNGWEMIVSPDYPDGWMGQDGWSACNESSVD